MLEFVLNRKHCIAFLVIGWLVRGIAFHFFPLVNDILLCGTVLWIGVILVSEMIRKTIRFDAMTVSLCGFLGVMVLTTALNRASILAWKVMEMKDIVLSIIEAAGLLCVLFPAAKYEEEIVYYNFLNRLFRIVFGYTFLLALASVFLFVCYRMDISLPGGFGSADQIFTYGHMGEETRFCGLFGYSTDGGNLCALGTALAVYLYERKQLPLIPAVLGMIVFGYTIVLLDVRTSMLAVLLSGMVLGAFLLDRWIGRKKAAVLMVAAAAVMVIAFIVVKRGTIDYYLELYREDPRETLIFLTTGRSHYWEAAVLGWHEKPIFGWGWMNNTYVGLYFDNHNLFFNILLWTGAAGIGLFGLFWILWLVRVIKRRQPVGIGVILILLVVFVQSMLDRAIMGSANTGVETMCFWLTAGMLCYAFGQPSQTHF